MLSKRQFLAWTGTTVLSLAGCVTANMEAVDYYIKGDDAYEAAEEARSNGDLEGALEEYERAAERFDAAYEASETEQAKTFSYEARELARLHARAARNKLEAKNEFDDEAAYERADLAEFLEADERTLLEEYEIRKTSAFERRTRIPT
ncbi:hypothetical protein SAMN05444422_11298 [Halobiforma haloterrestris]|uniref:Uncharacterized protein n=1 Tax=Natronobacterium haloterrestre TaxID=148448 RepID=A0A1I1KQN5_NATHA|nr:hypothetical protein [Halobiforma haloterrestris]SFC63107.1 hypothetical protein SAMN05444422_11298 [Halobiforma haloterrestris]